MVIKLNHVVEENNIVKPYNDDHFHLTDKPIVVLYVGIVVIHLKKWFMVYH